VDMLEGQQDLGDPAEQQGLGEGLHHLLLHLQQLADVPSIGMFNDDAQKALLIEVRILVCDDVRVLQLMQDAHLSEGLPAFFFGHV